MKCSLSKKFSKQVSVLFVLICFLIATQLPVLAADPSIPTDTIATLRQALKAGKVKLKVDGDGINTTSLRLQLTNTTDKPLKIVIPQNEVLHPNSLSIQTMLITSDIVTMIEKGTTAIVTIKTVCASPKTVPPPPKAQEGLNFDVGDYKDPAVWSQIAAIIAAGNELESVGAFEKILLPGENTIKAYIDEEIKAEFRRSVDVYMSQNPAVSKGDAEKIVERDQMDAIKIKAESNVTKREKQKRLNQVTQLAIWRVLGQKSGNPEDAVTPTSLQNDIIKELSQQIKMDKTLVARLGGKVDKSGNFEPSENQKAALQKRTSDIFDIVDLTVRRSGEAGLTNVATVPSDDPCDTFCSVGERAYQQGDFTEAQALLNSAIQLAQSGGGEADPRVSRGLNSLGLCYLNMTLLDEAKTQFDRALKLRKAVNAESKEVAEVENNLGLWSELSESYSDGDILFKSALALYEKLVGKTTEPVAETLNNLGKNQTIESFAPTSNSLSSDARTSLTTDARLSLTRALAVAMVNCPKNVKGDQLYTPFVAEIETNLADSYFNEGKFDQASALYQKALAIDVKALGEQHPYVATILNGLGEASAKLGKGSESEDYKKHAADILGRTLASGSKDLANMPLSTGDLGRLSNFIQGKKDFQASIASLRSAFNSVTSSSDTAKVNRPIKDKWALVIGISKFQDPTISLQYAAKDASDFAKFLVAEENFAPDHVRLLTNEKATRANILGQIGSTWLPRVVGADDLVVIFFSSHGSPSSMDRANINYLVSYDTDKHNLWGTSIELPSFAQQIKERVPSDRVVLFMDACHSGAALPKKGMFKAGLNLDATQVAQGSGQLVICSSQSDESSWESKNYANGVFTHVLIDALRKNGQSGHLKDVFETLKTGVSGEVSKDRGATQTPVWQSKWTGNDLIIGVKPTEPRPGITDGDPNAIAPPSVSGGGSKSPTSNTVAKPGALKPGVPKSSGTAPATKSASGAPAAHKIVKTAVH